MAGITAPDMLAPSAVRHAVRNVLDVLDVLDVLHRAPGAAADFGAATR
jgi:hypothetical protein